MPSRQDPHRQHHGRELKRAEELLVRRHLAKEALGRLRETEDGAEVDEEARGRDGEDEDVFAGPGVFVVAAAAEGDAEEEQDEQEGGEGGGLHRETGEQDLVARARILPVRLRRPNDGRAGNLHDGRQDVRRDEAPQYQLPRQPPAPLPIFISSSSSCCCSTAINDSDGSGPLDEPVDGEVDARGDEDGRHDDEEVLHYEPIDVIGIVSGRQRAEHVADRFKEAGEYYECEIPDAVPDYLEEMDDGADGEEDDGDDAECEGGRVSFHEI